MAASSQVLNWLCGVLVAGGLAAAVITLRGQAPPPPSTPVACGGSITILVNGQTLTNNVQGCVLNLTASNGVVATATPDPAIGGTDITFTPNTAVMATHVTVHGDENFCRSANGTSAYTCSMASTQALTAYALGMEFLLDVDTTCSSSCSLNIDANGVKAVKLADGATDPAGALIAGQAKHVWYDGTVFRIE